MAVQNTTWLNVSRLSGDVWRIEDGGVVAEYLLTGEEKALLIEQPQRGMDPRVQDRGQDRADRLR